MAGIICLACTTPDDEISFLTLKDLKVHEMTGHPRPPKELPKDPRPPSLSATEIKELEAKGQQVSVITKPTMIEAPKTEWIPPVLKYKWEGKCKKCNAELRTIEIDLNEDEVVVVAFCFNCNEKTTQRNVGKIYRPDNTFEKKLRGKK